MKVLVLGAAGKTGSAVVAQARAAGHEVTAFVHTTDGYDAPPGVVVRVGDATDPHGVGGLVAGQDAVIDTIGGTTPYKKDVTLERDTAAAVITAMRENGVRRLVVTSMVGVGDSIASSTAFERLLLKTFLRGATPDKAALEAEVETSGLDWTVVRPAVLTDDDPTGAVRTYEPASGEKARKISRADLATFLVGQLDDATHLGRAVTVATS